MSWFKRGQISTEKSIDDKLERLRMLSVEINIINSEAILPRCTAAFSSNLFRNSLPKNGTIIIQDQITNELWGVRMGAKT
jgi:hypothetical protein